MDCDSSEESEEGSKENLKARDYQIEIFEVAKKKNSIIVLGTGSGKTFISILLMKEYGHQIRGKLSEGAKRTFFIVNSVPLLYQQKTAIINETAFVVGAYEGSMGVDFWSEEQWKGELEKNEVIVIVAQIFLNIILHKLIKFSDINLLIIDECHHAQGNHPMREIMREYCSVKEHCLHILPRICGMTASVINCKVPHIKVPDLMKKLEIILDSSLITTHYKESVSQYMTNAKEIIIHYEVPPNTDTIRHIKELINTMTVKAIKDVPTLGLDEKHFHKAEKFINRIGFGLLDMLTELGEYCLCDGVTLEVNTLETTESDSPSMKVVYTLMYSYLAKLKCSLEIIFCSYAGILNHITPKVCRLLEILRQGRSSVNFHALVFSRRRNTAKLLYTILDKLSKENSEYAFLKSGVVVGGLFSIQKEALRIKQMAKQQIVINQFRQGVINVVVSTSVLEEGIDIRKCNLVIRFTIPDNFRSYIQSLGRARALPSYYILLCSPEGSDDLISDIVCYKAIHRLLSSSCFDRELPTIAEMVESFSEDSELQPFQPFGPLGPKITGLSALLLLTVYCSKLPKDCFTNLTLAVERQELGGAFYMGLRLPINSGVKEIYWSRPRSSYELAKKDAALVLCEELFRRGKLDANLLPRKISLSLREKDHSGLFEQLQITHSVIGTRKHRQLHERKICSAFKPTESAFLYAVDFHQIDMVRSDISFGQDFNIGIVCADVILPISFHLQHAKWGKLEVALRFIEIFSPADITDILPEIVTFHKTLVSLLLQINFDLFTFDPVAANSHLFLVPLHHNCSIDTEMMAKMNVSQFLNEEDKTRLMASPDKLLDSIIRPSYSKESSVLYFVKQIRKDYGPKSINPTTKAANAMTFIDCLKSSFGKQLVNEEQPLINCSHVPKNLNCLSEWKYKPIKHNLLLFIPELCDILAIPATFYWKLTCMPSILHRINGLQLERELLGEIGEGLNYEVLLPLKMDWVNDTIDALISSPSENICVKLVKKQRPAIVPGSLLQALTPIHTTDQFNLERLEVLGDAYLKFRTSVFLYLREASENEGFLTKSRSTIISNKSLFLLAEKRSLGERVQNTHLQSKTFPYPFGFVVKPEVEKQLISQRVSPEEWNKYGLDNQLQQAEPSDIGSLSYNPWRVHNLPDKCISDTVEALIGSMLLSGGEEYATEIMKWLGFKFINESVSMKSSIRDFTYEERTLIGQLFSKNCLDRLEHCIGYTFKNKCLLLEACVHPSYNANNLTDCYQRLEFLGDAVLDYLITGYIYARYRNADPGKITDWRSFYVNNERLAHIAVENRFHVYLLHFSPSLEKAINMFITLIENGEVEFNSETDKADVDDVEVPKALGDMVESIIGAVYVDSNYCMNTTWKLVMFLYDGIFSKIQKVPINCVRHLYERCSGVQFTSEQDEFRTIVTVLMEGMDPIKGSGKNKRVAKQAAAKRAINLLDEKEKNSAVPA